MKFKITLCACFPFPTSQGSQVLTHAIAQSLASRGHEVHLITYAYGESKLQMKYHHHTAGAWVPTRKLRAGPSIWKPLLDFVIAKKWLEIAKDIKADILHAINYEAIACGLWVKKRYRAPLISSIHGLLDEELPYYFKSLPAKYFAREFGRWFTKNVIFRSDAVLVLNSKDVSKLEELGLDKAKIVCHPPSVEISGDIPSRNESRSALGWQNKKVILYAGNLDLYQGLDVLYSAFRKIAAKRDDVILAVVTTSDPKPLFKELGDLQSRLRVLFTPDFEEIKRAIVACDAFVIPRVANYGFPIKLLNALALGAPIVIHQERSFGLVDKKEALFYGDSEASDLFVALDLLLANPDLASTISSGARLAFERFSMEKMATSIERLYQSQLERSGVF